MKNKNHTFSCYRYCNRTYHLNQKISQINDGRTDPTVKLPHILLTVIFSLMAGLHSFNAMEEAIDDGDFNNFFKGIQLPSADTISFALSALGLEGLRRFAAFIVQKARYNKSLKSNTIDGLKVVAIDGTDVFSMKSERIGKQAHKYEHKNSEGEITSIEYREKAVAASYVGEGFSPILKIERITKGEGELTAAKRLVDQLNKDHYQYCDVIVADSLYINSPFINTVLRNNKDAIVRVKQKNNLIKDAEGLFKNRKPDDIYENVTPKNKDTENGTLYDLEIWEDEGFYWSGVEKPLRALKVRERKKTVNAAGRVCSKSLII